MYRTGVPGMRSPGASRLGGGGGERFAIWFQLHPFWHLRAATAIVLVQMTSAEPVKRLIGHLECTIFVPKLQLQLRISILVTRRKRVKRAFRAATPSRFWGHHTQRHHEKHVRRMDRRDRWCSCARAPCGSLPYRGTPPNRSCTYKLAEKSLPSRVLCQVPREQSAGKRCVCQLSNRKWPRRVYHSSKAFSSSSSCFPTEQLPQSVLPIDTDVVSSVSLPITERF